VLLLCLPFATAFASYKKGDVSGRTVSNIGVNTSFLNFNFVLFSTQCFIWTVLTGRKKSWLLTAYRQNLLVDKGKKM
jgi:hypothetical protein